MDGTVNPGTPTQPVGRPGPLDRLLNLFSNVRPGEGQTALYLMLNVFLLEQTFFG